LRLLFGLGVGPAGLQLLLRGGRPLGDRRHLGSLGLWTDQGLLELRDLLLERRDAVRVLDDHILQRAVMIDGRDDDYLRS